MNKPRPKTSPKDFFLHLLNIVMLYITAAGFGRLLFMMINFYFPDVIDYYSFGDFNSIRWSIASLIVAFPVFLIGTKNLNKEYSQNPEKKNLRVKAWLEYFTMFGTAVIILVTFMTVIFKFLEGEITIRFILKALSMLYISGAIFGYYYTTVKYGLEKKKKEIKVLKIVVTVGIIAALVGGFFTVGTPSEGRARKFDAIRIENLESIQFQVTSYWQQKEVLPESLEALAESTFIELPADPETSESYEYTIKDDRVFELCANFNLGNQDRSIARSPFPRSTNIRSQEHSAGKSCFIITINEDLFPLIKEFR